MIDMKIRKILFIILYILYTATLFVGMFWGFSCAAISPWVMAAGESFGPQWLCG